MAVELIDNSQAVLKELSMATDRALKRIGMQAEGYAVDLVPVDTGMLRLSISHAVNLNKREVVIGSTSEYAAYVELGTGKYYPGGRKQPWVYQDAHGKWHRTSGNRPQPYLKPAIVDHLDTYKNIIMDELKGG